MQHLFEAPKSTLIYIFRINDPEHKDCLKIGETSLDDDSINACALPPNSRLLNTAAHRRIGQYTRTAAIPYELLYTESALYCRGKTFGCFNDKDVHDVLERSGIERKEFRWQSRLGNEWFCTDLETAKNAIKALKEGRRSLRAEEMTNGQSPIVFRPEQREAIDKTLKRFKRGNQMLWNAKMRFGKTLTALQTARELGAGRTLILTHRPVVDKGWFEDFKKIFYDCPDWYYGSRNKGEPFTALEQRHQQEGGHYIYFASMQDLRGSETVGGKFGKNEGIFSAPWDFIIVDEAHEGTQTELGQAVLHGLVKAGRTKVLKLSGTPFNLLDDFKEEEIYTWDYTMEQRAKQEWECTHGGDPNPYAGLPRLHIFTYDLGRQLPSFADETIAFNFREFFRVDEGGSFVHQQDVLSFLNLLSQPDEESHYPFCCEKYRSIFRHTLWVLPGVKAARALSLLLQTHPVFQHFQIVNVAGNGDGDEENGDALHMVEKAIGDNPDESYTITLSCGRLTTGVSVKAWMGVFMLAGSYNTSASAYMQTIFRVQTPATINGKVKEDCYAFDFAPDRTLNILASIPDVSTQAGKTTESQRKALGEFLNFCPVISIAGSRMVQMDTGRMLQHLKRAYVERAVQRGFDDHYLYNDGLLKLSGVEIGEFEQLKGIIGATKAIGNAGSININNQGLTNEEYEEMEQLEGKKKRERSAEEIARLEELKKKKELRKEAISILRGISIRMPLLIYGAEIQDEDKELTIDNFTSLIDQQSWEEFMPKGITKRIFNTFKKYYDAEIFTAAGKRIRAIARAADKLPVEERMARLAAIFATFRTPDKETVLTPWRVVNLHMGETLGGYNFFNSGYTEELEEPRYIDHGAITREVFAPGARLLEINSKSGLYPLYLAYNLYRERLKGSLFPATTLQESYAVWDRVVAENIFVICKTPMAKSITRRTLMGFRQGRVNTRYFENLINQIKNKPANFLAKVTKGHSYWKANQDDTMKFNAIVGNPPYQEVVAQKETSNGQKRSSSIFHHFQTISERLGRFTSLIYPGARWIHRSGKGLDAFGLQQINDPHLSLLEFFPDSTDVFKEVAIADGLSIVLKDMEKHEPGFNYIYVAHGQRKEVLAQNPGHELFPLNPSDNAISSRLTHCISHYGCLHDAILSQKLFSIESDFVEKNPSLVREYSAGTPFDPETEIKLLANDKAGKSGRARWYIASKGIITTGVEYLPKWKVIVSSANAGGQKRSNQIAIADNHSAFGRSRVALKTFDTEKEAQNFLKYAKSELIRFAFLLTDESLTSLAKKVPDLLDYSESNGMIDYNGDVDAQLYSLIGIDEENQRHIRDVLSRKKR